MGRARPRLVQRRHRGHRARQGVFARHDGARRRPHGRAARRRVHRLAAREDPDAAGLADVEVVRGDDSAILAQTYTYEAIDLAPDFGSVAGGTFITVSGFGTDFADGTVVTLETAYGQLVIPKKDIQRIDYQGAAAPSSEAVGEESESVLPKSAPVAADRGAILLHLSGRSFWYAFESGTDNATDTRIRLRIYIGNARSCTFEDEKSDTVDGGTLYNSFTFAATDAILIETLDGFQCSVVEAKEGDVALRIDLPPSSSAGRQLTQRLG